MTVPNNKDGNAGILTERRAADDPFYQVGASFSTTKDEHFYGLGQNQEGFLDRRGHVLRCAHDYDAVGGQSVCVPFVVTNKGYGIVWDNPSRTTVNFDPSAVGRSGAEVDAYRGGARWERCGAGEGSARALSCGIGP